MFLEGTSMPIHDWTKVDAGIFHHFHQAWINTLALALNQGRLPGNYYALAEQVTGGLGPDVLALESPTATESKYFRGDDTGGVLLADAPLKVWHTAEFEMMKYAAKTNLIAIRHASNHRVVAVIEIVSPGNKGSVHALAAFVRKAAEFLDAGVHLLVIDLFPPSRRDPEGIHGAIWDYLESGDFALPPDRPLTLAAYMAASVKRAYVEPVAVGSSLPDMPIFLDSERYVPAPLELTYLDAWKGVPTFWRERIAG